MSKLSVLSDIQDSKTPYSEATNFQECPNGRIEMPSARLTQASGKLDVANRNGKSGADAQLSDTAQINGASLELASR